MLSYLTESVYSYTENDSASLINSMSDCIHFHCTLLTIWGGITYLSIPHTRTGIQLQITVLQCSALQHTHCPVLLCTARHCSDLKSVQWQVLQNPHKALHPTWGHSYRHDTLDTQAKPLTHQVILMKYHKVLLTPQVTILTLNRYTLVTSGYILDTWTRGIDNTHSIGEQSFKCQVPSSNGLGVKVSWRYFHKPWVNKWIN